LAGFGGYAAIENRPADDLLVGRLIADQGYEVKLLRYSVLTVPDFDSFRNLVNKRLRWIVVMRHMRPWGHLGLVFTLGLPWALFAVAIRPTPLVALGYLGSYLALRFAITWTIGIHGLKQSSLWKHLSLIPIWDAVAALLWITSFTRRSIRWRNGHYRIENGLLVPVQTTVSE
jgi:ceramide glucosyltransferase